MSSEQVRAAHHSAGYGPFVTGLVLIAAAIALNLYLSGTSRTDLEVLPTFLATAYEKSGKLGVTMVLGSLGVLVMLWGWFLQAAAEAKDAAAGRRAAAARQYEPHPPAGMGSCVTLDTAKYVAEARHGRQNWSADEV